MRKRVLALFAFSALAAAVVVVPSAGAVSSKFDWHVADAFIQEGTGLAQSGATAGADNGDVARVSGSGTFNPSSGTATGGGVFAHTDADGDLVGFGTWTATGVESFELFGCGGDFPPNFCGGVLVLDVTLDGVSVAAGQVSGVAGVLTITCLIGEGATGEEGITLEIPGVIDFDETLVGEPSGLTLFVSRSKS
ncbi:MAG TPA: hypothetical protein VNO79_02995 [Actinomycetota bacterium]|nr:hypothetical protein [Actinomycetota bacterium]